MRVTYLKTVKINETSQMLHLRVCLHASDRFVAVGISFPSRLL